MWPQDIRSQAGIVGQSFAPDATAQRLSMVETLPAAIKDVLLAAYKADPFESSSACSMCGALVCTWCDLHGFVLMFCVT